MGSHCVSKLGVHRNFQAGREMAQGRPEGDSLHLRKAGQITHTLGHHRGSWNRRQLWLREAEAPLASEAVNPLHCQNLLVLPRSFLPLFSQSLVLSSPLTSYPKLLRIPCIFGPQATGLSTQSGNLISARSFPLFLRATLCGAFPRQQSMFTLHQPICEPGPSSFLLC